MYKMSILLLAFRYHLSEKLPTYFMFMGISQLSLKVDNVLREIEISQFFSSDIYCSMSPLRCVQVVEPLKLFLLADIQKSLIVVCSSIFLKGEILTERFPTFSTFIRFLSPLGILTCTLRED